MKNKIKFSFITTFWFLLIFSTNIFAGTKATDGGYGSVLKVVIAITAFLIAFVLWLVLVYAESNDSTGEKVITPFSKFIHSMTQSVSLQEEKVITPFSKFIHSMTQSVSLQEENDIMMDHDFDGIKELDNKIPPWWNFLFYGGIIFAFVYMIDYHVIGDGNVQINEYEQEIQEAAVRLEMLTKSGAMISEETVTVLTDVGALSSGKDIFDKNCAACHGFGGEGLVGPNFTDEYWIHGGSIKNIYHTIVEGVPAKGMISWKSQLSPNQIQEVGSFILSLKGTNPPNQKAAEGELWVEPSTTESADGA